MDGRSDGSVLAGDDLALFGELDAAVHRADGLCEDGAVGRSAAAGDGSAAAVEQLEAHAVALGLLGELALRAIQRRAGRQVAAVLHRVRVAQHDLLAHVSRLELGSVGGGGVQPLHRVRRAAQARDRFEERNDVHRAVEAAVGAAFHQPGPGRQGEQLQHRARVLGVGDDEVAHRLPIEAARRVAHQVQGRYDLANPLR